MTKPDLTVVPDAEGDYELNQKNVDQIIMWEKEADSLTGEADSYRAQAAGLIVAELDSGATERQVAAAIGKSNTHVHFAAVAYRTLTDEKQEVQDFNTAYKMAKRPKTPPVPESSGQDAPVNTDPGQQTDSTEETPFPPWSKQMREWKRLTGEMIEQANYKQAKELSKTLERFTRAAVTKEEDLAQYEKPAS